MTGAIIDRNPTIHHRIIVIVAVIDIMHNDSRISNLRLQIQLFYLRSEFGIYHHSDKK